MSNKKNNSSDSPLPPRLRALFVASPVVRNIGGLERQALSLASFLSERGLFFAMACANGGGLMQACREQGISTLKFHPANSSDFIEAARLAFTLLKNEIDIIHVHSRRDYLPAVMAVAIASWFCGRKRKRPRLIFHAHLVRELAAPGKLSERLYTAYLDRVIAVSKASRERIVRDHIIPDDRVRIIYNGVDFSQFLEPGGSGADEERRRYRDSWGVPQDSIALGMIGRLCDKGQERFVRVMPALCEKLPNLRVVMVGPEGDAGYSEKLSALAGELGVRDALILPGPAVNTVPRLLNAFDALIHLPTDEAFGLALVEAGAAGLPVVATGAGGCVEVVENNRNGLVVSQTDDDELIRAVLSLFDAQTGPELRAKLGGEGRMLALKRFSADKQHDRLLELYEEVCL